MKLLPDCYEIKGMSLGGGKLFYELSIKIPGKVLPAFIGDFDTYEQAKLAAIEDEAERAAYEAAERVYSSYGVTR